MQLLDINGKTSNLLININPATLISNVIPKPEIVATVMQNVQRLQRKYL